MAGLLRSPFWAVSLCALLAACGSGSAGEGGGAANGPVDVTVSGTVTFDVVPATPAGLDYAATHPSPARGVTVQLIGEEEAALATGWTDEQGRYSLSVAPDTDVRVRVRAEMVRMDEPQWRFTVVDNTERNALYALEGEPFNTGSANVTRDLHAASGWGGTSYTDERAAAPFAILDVVQDALALVLSVEPAAQLPPLQIHWSPRNVPALGADGTPDPATGEIGSSLYVGPLGIFLLGAEDRDTDEYDRHVIAHEWAHYYEDALSRTDSVGGPHARGDHLDPRVAFSEGFGNAFSALVTGERLYIDTQGPRQESAFVIDVAGAPPQSPNPSPGWYSEESIQEILYHLAAGDVGLGFPQVHQVLTGAHRTSEALTTIFTFIHALKTVRPDRSQDIDALVAAQGIDPVEDEFGSGETNAGQPEGPDVLPVYTELGVNQPADLCSTDFYRSAATGSVNKLGSRRFLKVGVEESATYEFSAITTSMPEGEAADPDMVLHQRGVPLVRAEGSPGPACVPDGDPAECAERFTRTLGPGNYVLEVYEWTNTRSHDSDNAPIGRTCFDVEVTRQ